MTREHYDGMLRRLDDQVLELGELVASTIESCVDALDDRDTAAAQHLIEADNRIDDKRYEIERAALLLIATQQPLAGDLRNIAAILTIATELERIGDYCEGIAKLSLRMAAETIDTPMADIRSMSTITERLLRRALHAFKERDLEAAGSVWSQDDEVDSLYGEVFQKLLAADGTGQRNRAGRHVPDVGSAQYRTHGGSGYEYRRACGIRGHRRRGSLPRTAPRPVHPQLGQSVDRNRRTRELQDCTQCVQGSRDGGEDRDMIGRIIAR